MFTQRDLNLKQRRWIEYRGLLLYPSMSPWQGE